MTGKHASTGLVSTDDGAQHSGSASARCATGREPLAGETEAVMRNIDFSRVNLHYLICARDLAKASPARSATAAKALAGRFMGADSPDPNAGMDGDPAPDL